MVSFPEWSANSRPAFIDSLRACWLISGNTLRSPLLIVASFDASYAHPCSHRHTAFPVPRPNSRIERGFSVSDGLDSSSLDKRFVTPQANRHIWETLSRLRGKGTGRNEGVGL